MVAVSFTKYRIGEEMADKTTGNRTGGKKSSSETLKKSAARNSRKAAEGRAGSRRTSEVHAQNGKRAGAGQSKSVSKRRTARANEVSGRRVPAKRPASVKTAAAKKAKVSAKAKRIAAKRQKQAALISTNETRRKFTLANRSKLMIVFMTLLVLMGALIIRLNYINFRSGSDYSIQVLAQQQSGSTTIPFKRGDILDRNGTVLATSEKVYNLVIDAYVILNSVVDKKGDCVDPTLDALEEYFGVDRSEIEDWINENPDSRYRVLQKQLSYSEVQPFNEMMNQEDESETSETSSETASSETETSQTEEDKSKYIKGIWFEEEYIRKYPYGSLACDVIGFTNSGNVGAYGLEAQYNSTLNGTDGREYGYLTDGGTLEQTTIPAVNGSNIVTTLDINVQRIIEKHIREFNEAIGSKNTAVIVQDVKSGEILGMASYPVFDLNDTRNYDELADYFNKYSMEEFNEENSDNSEETGSESDSSGDVTFESLTEEEKLQLMQSIWRNFAVSDAYEPGSTVKLVTIASALEEDTASPSDTFVCTGSKAFEGVTDEVACNGVHGTIDLSGALEHSCNVALMEIGLNMGVDRFTKYQNLFGFGQRTNIDLPGESSGLVYSADNMSEFDLAINAFGQTFTTTMVQVSSAVASILNDGDYYRPHMVSEVTSSEGNLVESYDSELVRKTVSEQTADFIKNAMRATVQQDGSTGTFAAIDGYDIGGKTGTAEKLPRSDGKCLVSFISAVPMDDPEVLVYTIIDEPNTVSQADSRLPQILTRKIYEELLPYLQIFPTDEEGDTTSQTDETQTGGSQSAETSETSETNQTDETAQTDETDESQTGETVDLSEDDTTQNTEMTEERKRELWAEYFPTNTNSPLLD